MNGIASVHKNKELHHDDIEEWCAQALKNIGEPAYFYNYVDALLKVTDGVAVLPCSLYRLQHVKPGNNSSGVIYYRKTGNVLRFDKHHVTNIYSASPDPNQTGVDYVKIDFIGIPMNADGSIDIPDALYELCYWYCLSKLYEEDVITGKINMGQYQVIEAKLTSFTISSTQSMREKSNNDLDRINRVVYNQMLSIRTPNSINA